MCQTKIIKGIQLCRRYVPENHRKSYQESTLGHLKSAMTVPVRATGLNIQSTVRVFDTYHY